MAEEALNVFEVLLPETHHAAVAQQPLTAEMPADLVADAVADDRRDRHDHHQLPQIRHLAPGEKPAEDHQGLARYHKPEERGRFETRPQADHEIAPVAQVRDEVHDAIDEGSEHDTYAALEGVRRQGELRMPI